MRSRFLALAAVLALVTPLDADAGKKNKKKGDELTERVQEGVTQAPVVQAPPAAPALAIPDWVADVPSSGPPVLQLIDAGAEPRQALRYGAEVGQTATVEMAMKMAMKRTVILLKAYSDSQKAEQRVAEGAASPAYHMLTSAFDWQAGARRTIDDILMDGMTPGSGEAYDWANLSVPRGCYRKGWVLAGGLHAGNVAEAIRAARPDVVDVASGVAGDDGVRKDGGKIRAFFEAVDGARAASGV